MAGAFARIVISILGGGAFYTLWMGIAIRVGRIGYSGRGVALLIAAPILTAAGYAAGMLIGERLTGRASKGFISIWLWALIGCAIGAFAVYPFGPMLIVFGMFVLGTVSVLVREIVLFRRRSAG